RLGQVARLVAEARAQTAGIGFLQADHVERSEQVGQAVEVVLLGARGQYAGPAAGDVITVTLHPRAGEDVAAEQAERVARRWEGWMCHGRAWVVSPGGCLPIIIRRTIGVQCRVSRQFS